MSTKDCAEALVSAVAAQLALELPTTRISLGDAADASSAQLVMTCRDAQVELTLNRSDGSQPVQHSVELERLPGTAWARTLALGSAELVAASASEPPAAKPLGAPPAPACPSGPQLDAKRPLSLLIVAGLTRLGRPQLSVESVGLEGQLELRRWLLLDASFLMHHASRNLTPGPIELSGTTARLALLGQLRGERWAGYGGLGARAGTLVLRGTDNNPAYRAATLAGPFGGPLALLGASYSPHRNWRLGASLEGGWVLQPLIARVDGNRRLTLDGPWLDAFLAVGRAI